MTGRSCETLWAKARTLTCTPSEMEPREGLAGEDPDLLWVFMASFRGTDCRGKGSRRPVAGRLLRSQQGDDRHRLSFPSARIGNFSLRGRREE